MRIFLTSVTLIALLGACTSQESITKPPVAYKTTREFPSQSYRGDSETTVRTSIKTENGNAELSGASCTLATPFTESQFQTPAIVRTPNLGPLTPTANLKCVTTDRVGQANLSPVNISLAERSDRATSAGAGAGLIGIVVSGVLASVNESKGDRPTDVHGYLPKTLPMSTSENPAGN